MTFIPPVREISPWLLKISNGLMLVAAIINYGFGLNQIITMIMKPFLPENYKVQNWKEKYEE